jgi:phosphoglucosamine mutase
MTIEVCEGLADALVQRYCRCAGAESTTKPMVLIGKDTRISGDVFEHALAAKFCSLGVSVALLGVVSTPLLSEWVRKFPAELGIMVSASHNIFSDNGLKVFKSQGLKLTDLEEQEIETIMQNGLQCSNSLGERVGTCRHLDPAPLKFYEKILGSVEKIALGTLVVDAANGSLAPVVGEIFRDFGAIVINDIPNGVNINHHCGAAHPSAIAEAVLRHKADVGIAFDGDGDRLILADHNGAIIDGDHILAILVESANMHAGEVVSTVMANLAFEHYLTSRGIKLVRTNVGDKYIAEYMANSKANIGGEPSGHIILKDHLPTGDALFAALKVLEYSAKFGRSISELGRIFQSYPTVSRNIKIKDKTILANRHIQAAIEKFQHQLHAHNARLVVRPSGTESLIRIYAEGNQKSPLENVVNQLENLLKREEI